MSAYACFLIALGLPSGHPELQHVLAAAGAYDGHREEADRLKSIRGGQDDRRSRPGRETAVENEGHQRSL